ncbi:MAG: TrkH family potassium uptake protein [Anaerolactibacter massiliensis]|nr:TrkH family potassium uptake protein [Anaerolactibacter massiliensis]MDY3234119.1 TrkH family potassium uptake protein [Erysipelotrichaceae bacterium]
MRNAMNYRMIARIISPILMIEAIFMIPAWAISYAGHEVNAADAIVKSQFIILACAAVLYLLSRNARKGFYAKEGLVTTGFSWIVMSALGCLPFYISREIPSYIDCLFEMVSGFTTTGSSILPEVESISRGLLYWRSFSHWLGGMGVLVFLMAVVPLAGKNEGFTLHILRAESPGPSVGKLVPHMKQTALILYLIYIAMTILNTIFLLLGGMSLFEAVCTAYGTAGTGGFGIMNDSMAGYSPYLQNVTTVFMLLFSVNFSCYYLLLLGRWKDVLKDEEFRLFWVIIFGFIGLIAWNIRSLYPTFGEALHQASFTVSTIISTTGFVIADYDVWPAFSKVLILCLMFIGACAGSTGGGLKVSRLLIMFKSLRRNFHMNMHPSEVRTIRINKHVVDEKVVRNAANYMIAYAFIVIISMILISLDGFDVETNLSAVMATFNNVGPGLAAVGPVCNFSGFSGFSKLVLIFDMLAGRLEIFPIAILFSKSTWRKQ